MNINIPGPSLDDLAELLKRQGEEERARQLAEQKAKEEAEAKAKAKAEREAKAKAEREAAKAKAEAEAKAKAAAEAAAKAKAEAEAAEKAKAEAEAKAKAEAEAKAKREAEAEAERKRKAAERLRKAAEAAKRQEEEDRLRLQKLFEEEERKRKEAEAKAKEEAEAKAKEEAAAKAKAEAEAKAKAEAEAKAKAEADALAERRSQPLAVSPKAAQDFRAAYKAKLAQGADYYAIDDVDEVDDWYDRAYDEALKAANINDYADIVGGEGGTYGGTLTFTISPDDYVEATGAPAYLKDILRKDKSRNEDEAKSAYAVLSITDSPEQMATVLSGYYGIDFSPVAQQLGQFGGNLGEHTDASQAQIAEFHSFIEPILQEQIPYLQLTRGVGYQDAVKAAFEEDPMIQALYGKYNIAPIRQTKDGSTYLYDPFTYGEMRTFESKDRDFQNAFKIITSIAASFYLPGMLSTALGISKAAATAAVAAGQTVVSGGDFEDVLKNAGLSFIGATAAEKLGNAKQAADAANAANAGANATAATVQAAQAANAAYTTAKLLYAATQVGSGAISGNLGAGVLAAFGPDLTTTALNKVGLTPELLDRAGVNQDLLVNGLVRTQVALTQGIELEDALSIGLGQYVLSGGGIAGINKDTFFEKMGEVLRGTGEAIGGLFSPSQADITAAAGGIDYQFEGSEGIAGLTRAQQDLEREEFSDLLGEDEYIRKYGIAAFNREAARAAEMSEVLGGYKPRGLVDEDGLPIFEDVNGLLLKFKEKPSLWANIFRTTRDIPREQKLDLANEIIDAPQFQEYLDAAGISFADRLDPQSTLNTLLEQSFGEEAPTTPLNFEADSRIADPNVSVADTFVADGVIELDIEGTKYTTEQFLPGVTPEARAASIGLAIDQIAESMARRAGGNASPADFRLDAMNAYVELRGEGYSHLRLLEESGVELTGRLIDAVSALDFNELAKLRNSDPEAYTNKLGRADSVTGNKESAEYVKENGVESATDGISVYEIAEDAVEAANNVAENILPAMLASGMDETKARELAANLEAGAINTTANMIRAGAGFTKAMLGLTYLFGARPDDLELGQYVNKLLELGDSANTEGYQARVKDMWGTIQEAEGFWGTTQAWTDALVDDPTIMLAELAGVELFQEIGPLLIGGGAGVIAKGAALSAAKIAGKGAVSNSAKVAVNKIGTRAGLTTAAVTDASEAFGGSADGAYDEAFDAKLKQLRENNEATVALMQSAGIPIDNLVDQNGLFPGQMDEIHKFAHDAAMISGGTATVLSLASFGLSGEALDKLLLGGKKTTLNPKMEALAKELGDRVNAGDALVTGLRAAKTAGKEGIFEYGEEALTGTALEATLASTDPNRDWGAAIASAGAGGLISSSAVTSALLGVDGARDALAGAVRSTHAGINATIEGAKRGLINDAQAKAALAEFGIASDEYGGLQTTLLNDAFDADYTTYTESKDAFQIENPDYAPTEADILGFTGDIAEDRLAASVADLVDRSYIDAQEAIDAAALEGLTLTNEQVAQYVRQTESGQAEAALNSLRSDVFDPMYVTNQEARDYFADIGYTPSQEDLTEFVGKSEEYASDNVAEYSENMLLLQLDGLLGNPNTTPLQLDSLLDQIESINPDSTARADAGIDDGGNRPQSEPEPEPDPVDDTTPDPVDDTTPDPVDDTTPDPVDDTTPDPVDDTTPDPVDDTTPDPVDDTTPDPVDDTTPEPDLTADQIAALSDQLTKSEQQLNDRIDQLQGEGKTRDEALAQAISELAGQLDTTTQTLLDIIGNSESSLRTDFRDELAVLETIVSEDMANLEASILGKMSQYQAEGLSRDEALAKAIEDVSQDMLTLETSFLGKMDQYQAEGLSRDEALARAIEEVSTELGTTKTELLDVITNSNLTIREDFKGELANLKTSLLGDMSNLETSILNRVAEYEAAGLSRDEALAQAIDELAGDLGTTKESLIDVIANSELTIREDFRDELVDLKASLVGDMSSLETNLLEKIAEYEATGLSRDEALAQAIADVSAELGTTEENLLDTIEDSELAIREDFRDELTNLETSLSEDMSNLEANILDKVNEYENAGLSRDEALSQAIDDLAGDLGTTKENLLITIANSELAIREDFKGELTGLKASLLGDMSNLEASILDRVAEYEAAGLSRDEALAQAIEAVSGELGTTEQNLLDVVEDSALAVREDFRNELTTLKTNLSEEMSNLETNLLGKMAEYENAGLSRDEALAKAIADVSGELGTTEQNLLDRITDSDLAIREDFKGELESLQVDLSEGMSNIEANLLEKIAGYEEAGLSRDEALAKAIEDVSGELGTTEQNLLDRITDSNLAIREDFTNELSALRTTLSEDVANLETSLLEKMAEYEGAGLSRDEALARSIADVSTELGTTEQNLLDRIADSDTAIREEFKDEIDNLQASLAGDVANLEANLLEKIAGYEAAGLSRDEALSQSVADVSAELGTTEQNLLDRIAGSELAIREDFGTELANLQASLSGDVANLETNLLEKIAEYEAAGLSRDEALALAIEDVSGDVAGLETNLLNKVAEYEAAGLSRDEALSRAVADVSGDVASLETNLLEKIAEYEAAGVSRDEALTKAIEDVSGDVTNLETTLLNKVAEYEAAGMSRDEALAKTVDELASDLGTTKETLLDAIADSELSVREDFKGELADLQTSLSGEVADLETNVLDKMAEYEAAGLSRDEALAKAIEDVSGDVDATTRTLLTKIDEAEQAGADRDTALRTSISDLANELGVTEETLLARIGESEESLRAAIGETEADLLRAISGAEGALTAEIEAVAELVGKPASEVTDADIDFVADLIAQQEAINDPATYTQEQLAYDVTGDGVVDQADLDLLQQARTGQDVLFDLDSMFAPTGLYAAQQQTQQAIQRQMEQQQQQQIQTQQELQQQQELQRQQQMQQQMQSQQAIQTQIAQEGERDAKRDFFDLLMGSSDLTGQKVTVDQSPLAQINYLYDIGGGSIFGDPNRAGFYERATPYSSGVLGAVQPRPLPTATPPVRRRRGGIIDANDELLRIIGES